MNEGTQRLALGYTMATILCVAALIKDGDAAMAGTLAAAAIGAGVGQYLGKRASDA